ncbi:MAG: hypothetical protein U0640_01175 [Phycisphaerales bacterium]
MVFLRNAYRRLVREFRFAPFSILLAYPIGTDWYNRLLRHQARRATAIGEDSLEFYSTCLRRSWIEHHVKHWIELQQVILKMHLGRHSDAVKAFQELIEYESDPIEQLKLIRIAISVTRSDETAEAHHRFINKLIVHRNCPETERLSLVAERAARLEAQADTEPSPEAKRDLLREALGDYSWVAGSSSFPSDAWFRYFGCTVRLTFVLDGNDAAQQVCAEHYRSDLLDRRMIVGLWQTLLWIQLTQSPEASVVWFQRFAEMAGFLSDNCMVDERWWLERFARALSVIGRPHLGALANNVALTLPAVLDPTERPFRVPPPELEGADAFDEAIRGVKAPLVVKAPLSVFWQLLTPDKVPPDRRSQLDHILLARDTIEGDPIRSITDAVDLLTRYQRSSVEAVDFVRSIVQPCGFGQAMASVAANVDATKRHGDLDHPALIGIDQQLRDRIAELLDSITRIGDREKVRDRLDDVAAILMDVFPASKRVEAFVWLASRAAKAGFASNAEEYVLSAKKVCMRYEELAVRLPMMLELCKLMMSSSVSQVLPELLRALAMEGRVQAASTGGRNYGYSDRERQEFKDLEQEFRRMT